MGLARRAMIYSGLVFPGLGQWILGKRRRGALIMCWIALLVLALTVRIFLLVYNMLYPSISRFQLPPDLISEVHKQAYLQNWWLLLLIIGIWIGSVADAYFLAKRSEAAAKTESQGRAFYGEKSNGEIKGRDRQSPSA